jgi:hypothetical protein
MSPPKKDDQSDSPKAGGTWNEWANHVLAELKRLNESSKNVEKEIGDVKLELAQLKVKSSIWGAVAGALTFVSFLGVNYLKNVTESKNSPAPQPAAYYIQYAPPSALPAPAAPVAAPVSPAAIPVHAPTPAPSPAPLTNPVPGKIP